MEGVESTKRLLPVKWRAVGVIEQVAAETVSVLREVAHVWVVFPNGWGRA